MNENLFCMDPSCFTSLEKLRDAKHVLNELRRENPIFREMVKIAITPMISSLSILNYVDMDSEVEVLGYGVSLIILNLGMYIGIPAIVIVGIRNKF